MPLIPEGEPVRFLALAWDEPGWEFDFPSVLLEPVLRYSPNGTAAPDLIEDEALDISIELEQGSQPPYGLHDGDAREFKWRGWSVPVLRGKAEACLRGWGGGPRMFRAVQMWLSFVRNGGGEVEFVYLPGPTET